MIDALISGKVVGTPSQRTSKNGNHFTVTRQPKARRLPDPRDTGTMKI